MTRQTATHVSEFDGTAADRRILLAAFELLRLRPRRLRQVLRGLAAPVVRLHGYRNTRTRFLRHALCESDCASDGEPVIDSDDSCCAAGRA